VFGFHGTVWEQVEIPIQEKPTAAASSTPQSQGSALTFDGVNDYVRIALNEPETEVTHEFWFKTDSPTCGLFSVVLGSVGATAYDRTIYLSSGNIAARLWSNEVISSSGLNLADNQWHHVAHVFGASIGGQKLYVDGQVVANGSKPSSDFHTQNAIIIGYSDDSPSQYFKGKIAEVRIWNKTRTPEELQANMSHFLKGNEEGLLGYWPLNEGSGDTANDKTSNNNNAAISGATWETAEIPIQERAGTVSFSRQQSQGTGLKDYSYWYHWEKNLPQQTDKKPFRRGRIWA